MESCSPTNCLEFGRSLLETLRQPMEDKVITVSRSKYTVQYPANFMLVASMNPCPCGYYNHPTKACVCSHGAVSKYLNRISGPMLDRIDLHIEVIPVDFFRSCRNRGLRRAAPQSAAAWWLHGRFRPNVSPEHRYTNAMMNSRQLREFCPLSAESSALLRKAMERFNLSARAYDRILKVSRTIADLAGGGRIEPAHIAEAIGYRTLDRDTWGA